MAQTAQGGADELWRCGTEDVVSGHSGDGLMVGLNDLSGPSNFNNFMTL